MRCERRCPCLAMEGHILLHSIRGYFHRDLLKALLRPDRTQNRLRWASPLAQLSINTLFRP